MKSKFKFHIVCLAVLSVAFFASCSSDASESEDSNSTALDGAGLAYVGTWQVNAISGGAILTITPEGTWTGLSYTGSAYDMYSFICKYDSERDCLVLGYTYSGASEQYLYDCYISNSTMSIYSYLSEQTLNNRKYVMTKIL